MHGRGLAGKELEETSEEELMLVSLALSGQDFVPRLTRFAIFELRFFAYKHVIRKRSNKKRENRINILAYILFSRQC